MFLNFFEREVGLLGERVTGTISHMNSFFFNDNLD